MNLNNYQLIVSYLKSTKEYGLKMEDGSTVLDTKKIDKDINEINSNLIEVLLKNELCKDIFFSKINEIYVLNQNKLIEVIFNTNEYMKGSFTKYTNKVGLFLNEKEEIQLNFPYKDCVLVGGMDQEDDNVNLEIFYNETLEKNKINKLFEAKVLHNAKKYFYCKSEGFKIDDNIENIKIDDNKKLSDNLLIKGNNLISLHSIAKRMSGIIDVIYIDPPYYFSDNKQTDSFAYNSNFKLSTWLTFMKNRLEIAKELMSEEGVIFISMNEDGNYLLKILCDEIFGSDNFVGNFMWNHGKGKKDKYIRTLHQNNLAYFKNKNHPNIKPWKENAEIEYDFTNPDNDPKGEWFSGSISFSEERSNKNSENYFKITSPSGVVWERQWLKSKKEMEELIKNNDIYFGSYPEYNNVPREKIRPYSTKEIVPKNIIDNCGTTKSAENLLVELMGELTFPYPKEVKLIKHFLKICSNKNSIILDFFAGSGTTAHAVLELNKEDQGNRKFILLEQMDYIKNLTCKRILNAMEKNCFEDNFIYIEMKESNFKEIKNKIKNCKNLNELQEIIENNFDFGFFINVSNKLSLQNIIKNMELKIAIKLLIENYMDNNLDYVSYNDIEELRNKNEIKESDYILNKKFYGE